MSYPEYYVQACEILRCRPEASFYAKQARFHRMMEQWQHDCYLCMNRQGQQPQLSEDRLAELQWAIAVIWESERSFEPRPEPSDWRDRIWQNLPMGQLIPQFSLEDEIAFWTPPAFADGIMYPVYQDFSIGAVDIGAEEEIWRFAAKGEITAPVVDQGVLVFGSTDRHVYALEASTGEELWRFRTTAQIRFPPAVWDAAVYFCAGHTQIHGLDLYSGARRWSARTDSKVIRGPFVYEESVFQFTKWGALYSYDRNTGERLWTASTDDLAYADLTQVGELLVAVRDDWRSPVGLYYGIEEKNGCVMSDSARMDHDIWAERTQSLVAFHILSGSIAWMLPMPGWIGRLFSSGGLIFGICHRADETAVFVIEGETGRELLMIGMKPEAFGRVLAHGSTIYYLDDYGDLYWLLRP